jgi:transposase
LNIHYGGIFGTAGFAWIGFLDSMGRSTSHHIMKARKQSGKRNGVYGRRKVTGRKRGPGRKLIVPPEGWQRDYVVGRMSIKAIAVKYGVSHPTVIGWRKRSGMARRVGRPPAPIPKGWRRDYEAGGMSLKQVAAKYGVGAPTVARWRDGAGLKARPAKRRPMKEPNKRHARILKLVRRYSQTQVARRVGVSKQMVAWVVKRWE